MAPIYDGTASTYGEPEGSLIDRIYDVTGAHPLYWLALAAVVALGVL